jgi:CubicO group peptidase (beta-lactamase class C family)
LNGSRANEVLERARRAQAFSAVSAEVGRSSGALWIYAGGTLGFAPHSPAVSHDTIFDLASLTKVLSATAVALQLVSRGRLDLESPVAAVVPDWTGADRAAVRVRDLLEHSSGLPAYRDYFRRFTQRDGLVTAAVSEPLEYAPRTKSVYSDLGFIVLSVALESTGGGSLDSQFNEWRARVGIDEPLSYRPPLEWAKRTAMTEADEWRGRVLQGEVHDENAAVLGGVAAHAGLFGTVAAVGSAARWWLDRLRGFDDEATDIPASLARAFAERSTVAGSSRALGWDTMLPTSSCGTRMSARAIGHTGFTGTSLWLDPDLDAYFVLLTNRVHPTRKNEAIQPVRRAFHDAAVADLQQR